MTLVITSLPLARVFQCLFTIALIGGNLTARSTGSHRGTGGGIQIPETLLNALLPFPAPPPQSPGELVPRLGYNFATGIPVPLIWEFHREVQNSLWKVK